MKRFYKEAVADAERRILLDGRPVKTPGRVPLAAPSDSLAGAIADEWNAQDEVIDPRSMPLTGLANAAIDRIAAAQEAFAHGLAIYGESDLLCYRAKCSRPAARDTTVDDAFGQRTVGLRAAQTVCFPAQVASTSSTTPGATTTTTTAQAGVGQCSFSNGECTGTCPSGARCGTAVGTGACECQPVPCGDEPFSSEPWCHSVCTK